MPANEMPSFGRLVIQLAWKNTWAVYRPRLKSLVVAIAPFVIGCAVFLFFFGWPDVTAQVWKFLAFTVVPGIAIPIVAFVWNICLAPAELVYEAIKELPVQEAAVIPAKDNEQIDWSIWKQRSQYTISEFAAIMVGRDPIGSNITHKQSAARELIFRDVEADKLSHIAEYDKDKNGFFGASEIRLSYLTLIEKDAAIAWAESKDFDVSHIK
jgi:hypothetical protein